MAFTKDEWWIVDSTGRRIGWLYPEDMAVILESFYGHRKWVNQFAADYGFSRSSVDRWKDGRTPIPKHVAMILNMLSTLKVRKIPMSPIEAPWLPQGTGANSPAQDEDTADAVEE